MSRHSARGQLWQAFRRRCIQRAGYRCERCGRAGRFEVHHKVPVAKGGKRFDFRNVEVVCRSCHFAEHKTDNPQRREWYERLGL